MKFSLALTVLTACAFVQETPTEREAARVVVQKMDALETSLDVPGWMAKPTHRYLLTNPSVERILIETANVL